MAEDIANCRVAGKNWLYICLGAFLILTFVFFKNAWVCDDAYINFRAIEQLFAGNGPNWNPHQRVQVYTSPLWFWLMAGLRLLSADHFFNAIILSFVLLVLLCFFIVREMSYFQASVIFLLLVASNAFMDFSSSGLENILCAFLLALTYFSLQKCFKLTDNNTCKAKPLFWLSLLPICRHDLLSLTLPLAIVFVYFAYQGKWERMRATLLMFLPLAAWSVFSLLYYGALFPNTAYAKLLTGIPRTEMLGQGFRYILVTLQQDPASILLLIAALFVGFSTGDRLEKAVSVGLLLNSCYIIWVGGDFMRGRFLTSALTLAVLLLAGHFDHLFCSRRKFCVGMALIYLVYLVGFPSTPLNTGFNYSNFNLDHGIADERGYYFDVCSLYSYLYSEPGEVFPDFEWSHIGRQIAEKKVVYLENDFNGMLGYWAGTRAIIVDRLALADPFLARMPVANTREWRIGHFQREVPAAYRESIQTGKNHFPDGPAKNLYELVQKAVAEKDLFSAERFLAILRLNLRRY